MVTVKRVTGHGRSYTFDVFENGRRIGKIQEGVAECWYARTAAQLEADKQPGPGGGNWAPLGREQRMAVAYLQAHA